MQAKKKPPRGAALFDLDHTLVTGNVSFLFGRFLYETGTLSLKDAIALSCYCLRHQYFLLGIEELHQSCFNLFFRGKVKKEIDFNVDIFLEKYLDQILFPPVCKHLNDAKKRGDYTAILSSSPDFLVMNIAKRLGVDDHLGTRYVAGRKGDLISVTDFVTGQQKADFVLQLQERGIDLKKTVGYSDSRLDLPFLEVVATPIAVRPDRLLRKRSRQEQWEIID